jgi:hypothetical protein
MKGRSGCKGNYAAHVKGIMPSLGLGVEGIKDIYGHYLGLVRVLGKNRVDMAGVWDIIIFTTISSNLMGGTHAQRSAFRFQDKGPSRSGDAQPPSRESQRRGFSRKRLLRSTRPGSNQVRDAATGAGRRLLAQGLGRGVRFLSALVLRGTSGFRGGGIAGSDSSAPGSSGSPQTDRGGDGLRRAALGHGRIDTGTCFGAADRRAVWRPGSSPKHRARSGATSKKTAPASTEIGGCKFCLRTKTLWPVMRNCAARRWENPVAPNGVWGGRCLYGEEWRTGCRLGQPSCRRWTPFRGTLSRTASCFHRHCGKRFQQCWRVWW